MAGSAGACNQWGAGPPPPTPGAVVSPIRLLQPHLVLPPRLPDVTLQDFCDRVSLGIWVRVLQKNGVHKMYTYVYTYTCYKELAHSIVEAGKSKICRASALVSVQRLAGCSRSRRRDAPIGRQSGRKNSLLLTGRLRLLFCPDLQLIGCGPPTVRRAVCFSQTLILIQTASLWKHPDYSDILTNYLSTLWPVKLTHEIKHHNLVMASLRENKNYQLPSRKRYTKVIRVGTVQPGFRSSSPIQPEGHM